MGPGVELLTATMRHYERLTGGALSVERIMAWHVRHALGDVLWRSEAGIPLADHRSPCAWVDDIAARLQAGAVDEMEGLAVGEFFASGASHAAGGGDHDAEDGSLVLHRAVQVADVGR
jgi:hypothetical protein